MYCGKKNFLGFFLMDILQCYCQHELAGREIENCSFLSLVFRDVCQVVEKSM